MTPKLASELLEMMKHKTMSYMSKAKQAELKAA